MYNPWRNPIWDLIQIIIAQIATKLLTKAQIAKWFVIFFFCVEICKNLNVCPSIWSFLAHEEPHLHHTISDLDARLQCNLHATSTDLFLLSSVWPTTQATAGDVSWYPDVIMTPIVLFVLFMYKVPQCTSHALHWMSYTFQELQPYRKKVEFFFFNILQCRLKLRGVLTASIAVWVQFSVIQWTPFITAPCSCSELVPHYILVSKLDLQTRRTLIPRSFRSCQQ